MKHQGELNGSYRLGIDLGGTKTEVIVLDNKYDSIYRKRVVTPANDYDAILKHLSNLVTEAENAVGHSLPVGIGTPGAISPRSGLIRNSNTVCMNIIFF